MAERIKVEHPGGSPAQPRANAPLALGDGKLDTHLPGHRMSRVHPRYAAIPSPASSPVTAAWTMPWLSPAASPATKTPGWFV